MNKIICRIATFVLCIVGLATMSSCSEDSVSLTLPVFEIGLPQEVHTGQRVKVDLVNKNNPKNLRYNNYAWSVDNDALTWESNNTAGGTGTTMTNYFTATAPGKYVVKVVIDITNYADGNMKDSGRTIQSGETLNTYTSVSTLKTVMNVTRTIIVK